MRAELRFEKVVQFVRTFAFILYFWKSKKIKDDEKPRADVSSNNYQSVEKKITN